MIVIPSYKQEKRKTCGLASLRMIFAYYGIEVSEKELLELTKLHSFGLSGFDLTKIANKYGFQVTGYTFKQDAYAKQFLEPNSEITEIPDYKNKYYTEPLKDYLKENKLFFHHPSISLIKSYLERQIPVIASYNCAAFGQRFSTLANGHAVVIKEITLDEVIFNDPATGKEQRQDIERFLVSLAIKSQKDDMFLMVLEKKNSF